MKIDKLSKNIKKKAKVKKKIINQVDLNSIQVPLSNKFSVLEDIVGDGIDGDSTSKQKSNISPVVVTNLDINIDEILRSLTAPFQLKLVSVGRKIFTSNPEDKIKLKAALCEKNIPFFSHPDDANKVFKAVLSGLPDFNSTDIESQLKSVNNLNPISVEKINTKSSNKLFVVYFNKSEVNMKILREIKVVLHHIIKWLPFKPKRKGPTQCYNCCMYGHGYSSCSRPAVCCTCSGNHRTTLCPLIALSDQSKVVPRCCNCFSAGLTHNHTANDDKCPFRAKYLQAKSKSKGNAAAPSKRIEKSTSSHSKAVTVAAPTPPALSVTYAQAVAPNNAERARNINNVASLSPPQSSSQKSPTSNDSQELWSIEEVTDILFSSINKLQQCKTKLDQLSVITNLLLHACK